MNGRTVDRGLDLATRLAGGAVLGLVLGLLAAASCSCSPQPPVCPSRQDDTESPAELAGGDACHRAGENLAKVCPALWRKDWDDFCRSAQEGGAMLCPAKLAKVRSCKEADEVCR